MMLVQMKPDFNLTNELIKDYLIFIGIKDIEKVERHFFGKDKGMLLIGVRYMKHNVHGVSRTVTGYETYVEYKQLKNFYITRLIEKI